MHHDRQEDSVSLLNTSSRIESELAELNARIARLAISLDAPLATEADIDRILNRHTPFLQPHARDHLSNPFDQGESRRVHQWEELRGLLVLRCELVAHALKDLGLQATLALTAHLEAQLERDGFKPGADGFDMLRRLAP